MFDAKSAGGRSRNGKFQTLNSLRDLEQLNEHANGAQLYPLEKNSHGAKSSGARSEFGIWSPQNKVTK